MATLKTKAKVKANPFIAVEIMKPILMEQAKPLTERQIEQLECFAERQRQQHESHQKNKGRGNTLDAVLKAGMATRRNLQVGRTKGKQDKAQKRVEEIQKLYRTQKKLHPTFSEKEILAEMDKHFGTYNLDKHEKLETGYSKRCIQRAISKLKAKRPPK